jgi:hypothetical protein
MTWVTSSKKDTAYPVLGKNTGTANAKIHLASFGRVGR